MRRSYLTAAMMGPYRVGSRLSVAVLADGPVARSIACQAGKGERKDSRANGHGEAVCYQSARSGQTTTSTLSYPSLSPRPRPSLRP